MKKKLVKNLWSVLLFSLANFTNFCYGELTIPTTDKNAVSSNYL